jgi:hypothetical protein
MFALQLAVMVLSVVDVFVLYSVAATAAIELIGIITRARAVIIAAPNLFLFINKLLFLIDE